MGAGSSSSSVKSTTSFDIGAFTNLTRLRGVMLRDAFIVGVFLFLDAIEDPSSLSSSSKSFAFALPLPFPPSMMLANIAGLDVAAVGRVISCGRSKEVSPISFQALAFKCHWCFCTRGSSWPIRNQSTEDTPSVVLTRCSSFEHERMMAGMYAQSPCSVANLF